MSKGLSLSERLRPYKERIAAANARWEARQQAKNQLQEPMVKVRLETSDGQFVSNVLLLPFKKAPEVVLWGSRHFWLYDENPTAYRECSVAVAFTISESQEMP